MRGGIAGFLVILLLAGGLGGVACAGKPESSKPVVMVSILPLAEFTQKVGGDRIAVGVMVPEGADPHTYEPRPSQMAALGDAVLYIKIGAGLEFELAYMDKIAAANPEMAVVDCSAGIELMDSNDDDSHSSTNPHIWLSPRLAQQMVANICAGLEQADPANAAYFRRNRDDYIADLVRLDADIAHGLAGVTNRHFLVLHPAWEYFARDYGLIEIAVEVDGKEPGAQSLAQIIDEAMLYNIKVVFTSPQFSTQSARAITQAIGGKVIAIDGLAKDYTDNMYYVLAEMRQAME